MSVPYTYCNITEVSSFSGQYGKAETYSEPSHTSKMELFAKIVND